MVLEEQGKEVVSCDHAQQGDQTDLLDAHEHAYAVAEDVIAEAGGCIHAQHVCLNSCGGEDLKGKLTDEACDHVGELDHREAQDQIRLGVVEGPVASDDGHYGRMADEACDHPSDQVGRIVAPNVHTSLVQEGL